MKPYYKWIFKRILSKKDNEIEYDICISNLEPKELREAILDESVSVEDVELLQSDKIGNSLQDIRKSLNIKIF